MRDWGQSNAIFYVYVVDNQNRLVGVVSIRRLVTAQPWMVMADILDPDVLTVDVLLDRKEITRSFSRYNLLAVPVVDGNNKLLGQITSDAVLQALEDEATEDAYKMAGTSEEEQASRSVLKIAGIRLPWLLVCLFGTFISAGVITFGCVRKFV